jgi:hypothetical protein
MNGKISRNLRSFAKKQTIGKPIGYTRRVYQNLKKYYRFLSK